MPKSPSLLQKLEAKCNELGCKLTVSAVVPGTDRAYGYMVEAPDLNMFACNSKPRLTYRNPRGREGSSTIWILERLLNDLSHGVIEDPEEMEREAHSARCE